MNSFESYSVFTEFEDILDALAINVSASVGIVSGSVGTDSVMLRMSSCLSVDDNGTVSMVVSLLLLAAESAASEEMETDSVEPTTRPPIDWIALETVEELTPSDREALTSPCSVTASATIDDCVVMSIGVALDSTMSNAEMEADSVELTTRPPTDWIALGTVEEPTSSDTEVLT